MSKLPPQYGDSSSPGRTGRLTFTSVFRLGVHGIVQSNPLRLYTNVRWPLWLAFLLVAMTLSVIALYFLAPDVPKLPAIPVLMGLGYLLFRTHRAGISWIEISPDGRLIFTSPSWFDRRFYDENPRSVTIQPGSQLLLCQNFSYGAFDGYSVVIRNADGAEQLLWKNDRGLDLPRCAELSQAVTQRFELPVRLVARRLDDRGIAEEEWAEASHLLTRRIIVLLLALLLLPAAGILVRLLTSVASVIALVGMGLWLAGLTVICVALRALARREAEKVSVGPLAFLAFRWTLSFVLLYGLAAVVTGKFLKH
jgi:hypothetical protein